MANRLALAQSPYLRQHADNPVDWQEWGEEAFARARAEDKPIFLSIGYSTCHWCHVMAHESFENPDLAALLNTHFVPIKVDREERPDVDRVYMTYVQALTGHGGWPLSAWLTPDLKPFYGGTYFPPEDRGGRHGFGTVLRAIGGAWRDPAQRASMVAEGNRVVDVLRDHATASAPAGDLGSEELWLGAAQAAFERGFQYFQEAFDPVDGGFGSPPKFPRASVLTFLFRCAALQGVASETGRTALHLATNTLRRMAQGGIHDHVGGGFHRYSVDGRWFVPHFEKMLYDQAQIAVNYLDACRLTGDRRHGWLARDILDYVLRDLRHPDGGFYSAEDADSLIDHGKPDHAEGAFYVWTPEQLEAALGPEDAALAARHFAVRPGGNVPAELDPHGEFRGRCILAQGQPLSSTAEAAGLDLESANERVLHLLERLREARRQRPRPHLDTKIITAWNGLAISAFARAHVVLERTEGNADSPYLQAAIAAATFVRRELFDPVTGLLYRTFGTVRGPHPAFAEDYAGLIAGLLDLHHATFDTRWLEWSDALQTTMDARFWDEPAGGYFSAAAGDPSLILRLKDDYDGAEPAASSVAAGNLARLAQLLPDDTRAQRARRTIAAFHNQWSRHPQALPQMLVSLELTLESPRHVVLVGNPTSPDLLALARAVDEVVDLSPGVLVLRPDAPADAWLLRRAPWLAGMPRDGVPATAYVCHHYACQPPVTTPEALTAHLVAAIPRPAESRN